MTPEEQYPILSDKVQIARETGYNNEEITIFLQDKEKAALQQYPQAEVDKFLGRQSTSLWNKAKTMWTKPSIDIPRVATPEGLGDFGFLPQGISPTEVQKPYKATPQEMIKGTANVAMTAGVGGFAITAPFKAAKILSVFEAVNAGLETIGELLPKSIKPTSELGKDLVGFGKFLLAAKTTGIIFGKGKSLMKSAKDAYRFYKNYEIGKKAFPIEEQSLKEGKLYDKESIGGLQGGLKQREELGRPLQKQEEGTGEAEAGGIFFTGGKEKTLTLDTPFGKITGDSATRQAEFISNIGRTPSLLEKGYTNLDVPTSNNVLPQVLGFIENDKVFQSVIPFIPIDVMNNLASQKFPSNKLFHDKAMFISAMNSTTNPNIIASVVNSIISSPAFQGAKISLENSGWGAKISGIAKRADNISVSGIPSQLSHKGMINTESRESQALLQTPEEQGLKTIAERTGLPPEARTPAGEGVGKAERLSQLKAELSDYEQDKRLFGKDEGLGIDNISKYDRLIQDTKKEIDSLESQGITQKPLTFAPIADIDKMSKGDKANLRSVIYDPDKGMLYKTKSEADPQTHEAIVAQNIGKIENIDKPQTGWLDEVNNKFYSKQIKTTQSTKPITLKSLIQSGRKIITQDELNNLPDVKNGRFTPKKMRAYIKTKGIEVEEQPKGGLEDETITTKTKGIQPDRQGTEIAKEEEPSPTGIQPEDIQGIQGMEGKARTKPIAPAIKRNIDRKVDKFIADKVDNYVDPDLVKFAGENVFGYKANLAKKVKDKFSEHDSSKEAFDLLKGATIGNDYPDAKETLPIHFRKFFKFSKNKGDLDTVVDGALNNSATAGILQGAGIHDEGSAYEFLIEYGKESKSIESKIERFTKEIIGEEKKYYNEYLNEAEKIETRLGGADVEALRTEKLRKEGKGVQQGLFGGEEIVSLKGGKAGESPLFTGEAKEAKEFKEEFITPEQEEVFDFFEKKTEPGVPN